MGSESRPSVRITMTSPSPEVLVWTDLKASSSRSKRRAGTVNFRLDIPATFTIAPLGGEISLQADHTANGGDRPVGRAHHVLVRIPFHAFEIFGDRAAGDGSAISVQMAVIEQRFHQNGNAPNFKYVFGDITTSRPQIRDTRFFSKISPASNGLKATAASIGHGRTRQAVRPLRHMAARQPRLDIGPGVHREPCFPSQLLCPKNHRIFPSPLRAPRPSAYEDMISRRGVAKKRRRHQLARNNG